MLEYPNIRGSISLCISNCYILCLDVFHLPGPSNCSTLSMVKLHYPTTRGSIITVYQNGSSSVSMFHSPKTSNRFTLSMSNPFLPRPFALGTTKIA